MRLVYIIFSNLWKVYFLLWVVITLLLLYPVYSILLLNPKHFTKGFKLIRGHALFLMLAAGIIPSVNKEFELEEDKAYVITPNHTSYIDILMVYYIFPEFFIIMGKRELLYIPLFNIFFKRLNVTVNRKSSKSGKLAYDRMKEEIGKGHNIILFPEGTIPDNNPKMIRFKPGAFKLAIEHQIPIIPITFKTNYKLLQDNGFFRSNGRPGIARAVIHPPVSTKGLTQEDLVNLSKKVYNIIDKDLDYER